MNKIFKLLLVFIFITNCSYHKTSKFWSKEKTEKEIELISEEIFKKKETINLEFNPTFKINLYVNPINDSFLNNLDNNNGRINYSGELKNISKYKFSKIKNFYENNPEILFNKNNIIFFENKGSILNFDSNNNLVWKKNYYLKREKKQNPMLFFANNKNSLIVADSIAKIFALDISNGELLWSKINSSPFNSQIKIYKDKFFIIDFENILRAYSINNGKEIWNVKTKNSLIRSKKRLSIVIADEKIYFNNTSGDITSVDINTGELIWQTPTQSKLNLTEGDFLKTSDIIADKEALYFSNNKNRFFSIDKKNGTLNWAQEINSKLRPTIVDNYLFTVSKKGYLIVLDKRSGKIIRITYIFDKIKNRKKNNIEPTGFIVGVDNIYITTTHGRLLEVEIETGKTKNTIKIDRNKISRPLILNQDLYITTDNSIIKLN